MTETLVANSKAIKYIARGNGDKLLSVHRIAQRRGSDRTPGLEKPKRFTRLGIERNQVSGSRASKHDPTRCAQHTCSKRATNNRELPRHLTSRD